MLHVFQFCSEECQTYKSSQICLHVDMLAVVMFHISHVLDKLNILVPCFLKLAAVFVIYLLPDGRDVTEYQI